MAKEYKVIKITEMMRPSDTQGVETFYRHTIKTAGGTVLNVEVSRDDFTRDKAGPILSEAARNADEILKL